MDHDIIVDTANTIRTLTLDAIYDAQSGHPGICLGIAEVGALIYGEILKYYPEDPQWIDRDRFVLSAGHGSMLLYSLLLLSGYDFTVEDLKQFRSLGSKTPGHPEYNALLGIETTTGPLGQGFATAAGMAIAERMLAAEFNTSEHTIIDHYTYVLASEGDIMEGVASEAASVAGALGLGKLIVFLDHNNITIDGNLDITFNEDIKKRFESYQWEVFSSGAYDLQQIMDCVNEAKKNKERPSIIILNSVIGKESDTYAGTCAAHGSVFEEAEIETIKEKMGVKTDAKYWIPDRVKQYFQNKRINLKDNYNNWKKIFYKWKDANPEKFKDLESYFVKNEDVEKINIFPEYKIGDSIPTRVVNGEILDALMSYKRNIVTGSADLTIPNFGKKPGVMVFNKKTPMGRFIHFGIREHGMAAITNGLTLYGGLRGTCATFLTFSDYMRPSIRLAALMNLPVIYLMTHDSVFIGQDGPTHQPIEHLSALRAIPNLLVLRPADAQETVAAWKIALSNKKGPSLIAFTRQNVTIFPKSDRKWFDTIKKGAYIVKDATGIPDLIIVATGSEVQLALKAVERLQDKQIRVISMISRELFFSQDKNFQRNLLPEGIQKVVIEAGVAQGWEKIFCSNIAICSIERFGVSAPGDDAGNHLGISVDALINIINNNEGDRRVG